MKKVAVLSVILTMLLLLCGCGSFNYFNYDDLINKVQSAEIIEYNSDTNEEQSLFIIPNSDLQLILQDLSQLEFRYTFLGSPELATGLCIKLNYKNNDCEIVTFLGTSKDKRIQCNQGRFEEMLQKYYSD